jgi:uncharacterized membrane protein YedE/YeeE
VHAVLAFVAGLTFALGLIVSGLFNPAKVLAFLDLAGRWDPSLLVVMATAVLVSAVAVVVAKRRQTTLLGDALRLPSARDIDPPLVLGSLVFGVGWGLAGICPGPGIVLLGAGLPQGIVFVTAMLAGMAIHELVERARAQHATAVASPPREV